MTSAIKQYKSIFDNNPSSKEAEAPMLSLQEIYIIDLGQSDEYIAYVGTLPGYSLTGMVTDSLAYMVGDLRYNDGEYDKSLILGFDNYLTKYQMVPIV